MISYTEACDTIFRVIDSRRLETEVLPLGSAIGRICAQDIFSSIDIQPFDNSAMDGFAVFRQDLIKATQDHPVRLKKSGIIAAGDLSSAAFRKGTCVQIMTGAPLPSGADSIVPVELVKSEGENVIFFSAPEDGAHIRYAGEDFKSGNIVMKKGTVLETTHILPLAALGVSRIEVFRKPRIIFLSTGKELVDDLSSSLDLGQIYNSNLPYALAFLEEMGCECLESQTIRDEPAVFVRSLSTMLTQNPDFIISSGAVSAGEFDFVRNGLEAIGAEILYHKVKIKPGKPNLLAKLPNGTLYFGLPGNPVATAVGLRFFVDLAIRALSGLDREEGLRIKLDKDYSKKAGLQMFLKGRLTYSKDGELAVSVLEGQDSFMVSPFLQMNVWISVPEDVTNIKAGDFVDVYPLSPRKKLM